MYPILMCPSNYCHNIFCINIVQVNTKYINVLLIQHIQYWLIPASTPEYVDKYFCHSPFVRLGVVHLGLYYSLFKIWAKARNWTILKQNLWTLESGNLLWFQEGFEKMKMSEDPHKCFQWKTLFGKKIFKLANGAFCQYYFHLTCTEVTSEKYSTMLRNGGQWFYEHCRSGAANLFYLEYLEK